MLTLSRWPLTFVPSNRPKIVVPTKSIINKSNLYFCLTTFPQGMYKINFFSTLRSVIVMACPRTILCNSAHSGMLLLPGAASNNFHIPTRCQSPPSAEPFARAFSSAFGALSSCFRAGRLTREPGVLPVPGYCWLTVIQRAFDIP